ncbi:MAG: right-handed parallel beta-helix repeat-containing protein [Candidatus Azobacteroides sp.]|nr:right-handed parallel beta-helix repeat-containing protein [Candidatus Azobacteroides sp.]
MFILNPMCRKNLTLLFILFALHVSAEKLVVMTAEDSGEGSLRELLLLAAENDSIVFDKSLKGEIIKLNSPVNILFPLAINGLIDEECIELSGGEGCRIFNLESENIRMYNLVFGDSKGGAVISEQAGNLLFENCRFKNNFSTEHGGAIRGYDLYVSNCIFESNTSEESGGAVYCNSATFLDCMFHGNVSEDGDGGAVYATGSVYLSNCSLRNNMASSGGAVYTGYSSKPSFFEDCTFLDNMVGVNGGAVRYLPGMAEEVIFTRCTFQFNTALRNGGAVYAAENLGAFSGFTNCTFDNNGTSGNGGGIYISDKAAFIKNTFSNHSSRGGNAIYGASEKAEDITLKGNIFLDNYIIHTEDSEDAVNVVSEGYNIYNSSQAEIFSHPDDYKYTEEENLLGILQDNGGKTLTRYINTSLPEWEDMVRRVPVSKLGGLTIDQRGLPLPVSGMACAGALEVQPGEDLNIIFNEDKKIHVFPNPTTNNINFTLSVSSFVQLVNISGQVIFSGTYEAGEIQMDLTDYPEGLYLLKINQQIMKILKK